MGKECVVYLLGDRVLYGIHGICEVRELETKTVDRKKVEYYVLVPLEQPAARFYVPTQNQAAVSKLRKLMTAEELKSLLETESVREDEWIQDENKRKLYYRSLINSGDRSALLRMIRTLHNHKQRQAAAGRKFHLCDENFLRDAEKLLTAEFSMVLGIAPSEVADYIRENLHIKQ